MLHVLFHACVTLYLMGPISAGFSALESCETGILPSVTVLSVNVCFTNK